MPEANLLAEFDKHIARLVELRAWFDGLYHHPEYGKLFLRPALSLLITACDFILSNLREFRTRIPV